MIAVNADTGKACESFADHGTLDLLVGMGVKTAGFYEPTSPPVVSDKILVSRESVIDNYSTHEPSGVIRGFDIHTGKLIWAWDAGAADENALPSADYTYTENSPNSWMTASYDAKLGLVYLPMGVQTPDIWGGNRGELAERYSSALVALDINTGKRVWAYQTVHHDLWDMDLPSQPTLVDLTDLWRHRSRGSAADQDGQSVRPRSPHRAVDRARPPSGRCRRAPRRATM